MVFSELQCSVVYICKEADHGLNLTLVFEGQALTSFFSMSPLIIAKAYDFVVVCLRTSLSLVSCECLFFSTQFRRNKVREYVPDSDSDVDSDKNEDPDLVLRRVSQTSFLNFFSQLLSLQLCS